MTDREVIDLAKIIEETMRDWDRYISECQEAEEEPHWSRYEYVANELLESGYCK